MNIVITLGFPENLVFTIHSQVVKKESLMATRVALTIVSLPYIQCSV